MAGEGQIVPGGDRAREIGRVVSAENARPTRQSADRTIDANQCLDGIIINRQGLTLLAEGAARQDERDYDEEGTEF